MDFYGGETFMVYRHKVNTVKPVYSRELRYIETPHILKKTNKKNITKISIKLTYFCCKFYQCSSYAEMQVLIKL